VPVLRPGARRFLLIGCGGGAMLRLLEAPGRTFDVLDLDPAVVRAAREDFGAGVEGATFHVEDGRRFLRRGGQWDAILLDVVSTDSMPEHLCSVEFLREAREHLTPGGVLFMNSIGAPRGIALASLERTIRRVFPHVLAYTAHERDVSVNVLWLASDVPLELPETPTAAYAERTYAGSGDGVVLRDDFNPINFWNADLGLELRRRLQERLGTALSLPR
jgi:spermidine synthase